MGILNTDNEIVCMNEFFVQLNKILVEGGER